MKIRNMFYALLPADRLYALAVKKAANLSTAGRSLTVKSTLPAVSRNYASAEECINLLSLAAKKGHSKALRDYVFREFHQDSSRQLGQPLVADFFIQLEDPASVPGKLLMLVALKSHIVKNAEHAIASPLVKKYHNSLNDLVATYEGNESQLVSEYFKLLKLDEKKFGEVVKENADQSFILLPAMVLKDFLQKSNFKESLPISLALTDNFRRAYIHACAQDCRIISEDHKLLKKALMIELVRANDGGRQLLTAATALIRKNMLKISFLTDHANLFKVLRGRLGPASDEIRLAKAIAVNDRETLKHFFEKKGLQGRQNELSSAVERFAATLFLSDKFCQQHYLSTEDKRYLSNLISPSYQSSEGHYWMDEGTKDKVSELIKTIYLTAHDRSVAATEILLITGIQGLLFLSHNMTSESMNELLFRSAKLVIEGFKTQESSGCRHLNAFNILKAFADDCSDNAMIRGFAIEANRMMADIYGKGSFIITKDSQRRDHYESIFQRLIKLKTEDEKAVTRHKQKEPIARVLSSELEVGTL